MVGTDLQKYYSQPLLTLCDKKYHKISMANYQPQNCLSWLKDLSVQKANPEALIVGVKEI